MTTLGNTHRVVILVSVCLHIPYDLVAEQLRNFRCFKNESLDITQLVNAESLYDLRDEEERQFHRVLLEDPHGILQDQRMVAVSRLEVHQSGDRRDRCPDGKPLE